MTPPPGDPPIVVEFRTSDVFRSAIALALAFSLPFVIWRAGGVGNDFTKTYLDAVTAVVAYYFAARGNEGAMAAQEGEAA